MTKAILQNCHSQIASQSDSRSVSICLDSIVLLALRQHKANCEQTLTSSFSAKKSYMKEPYGKVSGLIQRSHLKFPSTRTDPVGSDGDQFVHKKNVKDSKMQSLSVSIRSVPTYPKAVRSWTYLYGKS